MANDDYDNAKTDRETLEKLQGKNEKPAGEDLRYFGTPREKDHLRQVAPPEVRLMGKIDRKKLLAFFSKPHVPNSQPSPKKGRAVVLPWLFAALQVRSDGGVEKYGTRLMSFNGRAPFLDAIDELLDLLAYLAQGEMEAVDLKEWKSKVCALLELDEDAEIDAVDAAIDRREEAAAQRWRTTSPADKPNGETRTGPLWFDVLKTLGKSFSTRDSLLSYLRDQEGRADAYLQLIGMIEPHAKEGEKDAFEALKRILVQAEISEGKTEQKNEVARRLAIALGLDFDESYMGIFDLVARVEDCVGALRLGWDAAKAKNDVAHERIRILEEQLKQSRDERREEFEVAKKVRALLAAEGENFSIDGSPLDAVVKYYLDANRIAWDDEQKKVNALREANDEFRRDHVEIRRLLAEQKFDYPSIPLVEVVEKFIADSATAKNDELLRIRVHLRRVGIDNSEESVLDLVDTMIARFGKESERNQARIHELAEAQTGVGVYLNGQLSEDRKTIANLNARISDLEDRLATKDGETTDRETEVARERELRRQSEKQAADAIADRIAAQDELAKLKVELADLEAKVRRVDEDLANCDDARVEAEGELRNIDAVLGNREAFDDCATRAEKVQKAINGASKAWLAEKMGAKPGLFFSTLREANALRQKEWDREGKITLSFRGNELGGECGEAQNVIKKLERERLGIAGSRDTKEHLAEELADVVICSDLIAMQEDINLGAAVVEKFNATSKANGLSVLLKAKP